MEDMINQAIRAKFKTLCFTDHMDFDYPQIGDYSFDLDVKKILY